MEHRLGAVVRALASHQCGPGSIPGPDVICGLSLLLVLYSAPRGFSSGTPVFPSHPKKTTFQYFQIPIQSWNARTFHERVLVLSALWVNELHLHFFFAF